MKKKKENFADDQIKIMTSSLDMFGWACFKISMMFFGMMVLSMFPVYLWALPVYLWAGLFIVFLIPPMYAYHRKATKKRR